MKTTIWLTLVAGIATSTLTAQGPAQSPISDGLVIVIGGRVIADVTGDPIPNARVTLAPEPRTPPVVLTDVEGHFSLTAPAGRYRVVAGKTGYARREAPSTVLGQAVEIRLKKGAAISGHVLDEAGDPVIGVHVAALTRVDSATNTTTVAAIDTDDRGEYHLAGLPEGTFIVVSTITKPVQFSGSSLVYETAQKTYYPGVATPADAQEMRLQPGEERLGLDFVVPAGQASGLPFATLAFQLRRPQNSAPRGAGIVRGRVADVDGRAIPQAEVLLFAATRAESKAATTDQDGRFEIEGLGTAAVKISAIKAGYTHLESGQAVTPTSLGIGVVRAGTLSNFAWGRALDLAAGEMPAPVELTLARWGTLSGRISDEYGEPMQGATVQLLHMRYEAGRQRLVAADAIAGATDDLGRYRLHSLAPGQYIISAAVGQVSSEDLPGYARSYYPGTPNPDEAQFVSVVLSQDIAGVDFSLSRVRTARVAGQVLNPAGEPASPGTLLMWPSQRSSSATSVAVGARIGPDGTFVFPNVPPGQYVIQAYRGRSNARTEGEFGALPVAVNGTDVTDLSLRISSGSSITGRFTFDTVDRAKAAKPSQFELAPIPADFDLSPPNNWASAEIQADWTFEIAGLNGPRRLQMLRAPSGWALKAIRVNGIDLTDRPLPLGRRDESLANVEVVMTDRMTELSGTITDDRARPAPPSKILVFSTDRDRWYPASRYLRQTASTADGTFTVAGLPPGSYYTSVVAQIPTDGEDAWQDPQFLESLVAQGTTVTVVDGEEAKLALRVNAP